MQSQFAMPQSPHLWTSLWKEWLHVPVIPCSIYSLAMTTMHSTSHCVTLLAFRHHLAHFTALSSHKAQPMQLLYFMVMLHSSLSLRSLLLQCHFLTILPSKGPPHNMKLPIEDMRQSPRMPASNASFRSTSMMYIESSTALATLALLCLPQSSLLQL
jgi:hypothetical protein